MFRFEPPDLRRPLTRAELRDRARELVLLELRHQPLLKARAFAAGFGAGLAAAIGLAVGALWLQ